MGEYRKERKRAQKSDLPAATRADESKQRANNLRARLSNSGSSFTPGARRRLELLLATAARSGSGVGIELAKKDLAIVTAPSQLSDDAKCQAAADTIAIQSIFDERLVALLKREPSLTRSLPGNIFEELIAEILAFLGFADISLRVQTDLGEVDILGFTKDHFGSRVAYLFELKQFGKSGRPVELREITRLFGLREGLRHRLGLTQGAFVTTTSYTKAAEEGAEVHGLSLKNYDNLVDWLSDYQIQPNGLYLRNQ